MSLSHLTLTLSLVALLLITAVACSRNETESVNGSVVGPHVSPTRELLPTTTATLDEAIAYLSNNDDTQQLLPLTATTKPTIVDHTPTPEPTVVLSTRREKGIRGEWVGNTDEIIKVIQQGDDVFEAITIVPAYPEPRIIEMSDVSYGYTGTTSLEERILHSDIIVRAKLKRIKATAKVESIKATRQEDCRFYGGWIPVTTYEFEALEFLKGQGQQTLKVHTSFGAMANMRKVYESKQHAIDAAKEEISYRDTKWDEEEAILFVQRDLSWVTECDEEEGKDLNSYWFALSGHIQAPEYRIESRHNRVWLPAIDRESQEEFILMVPGDTDPFSEGVTATIQQLRNIIDELELSIQQAEEQGITGYKDCLVAKYARERLNYATIAAGGYLEGHWWSHEVPPSPRRRTIFSGLPVEQTNLGEVSKFNGYESTAHLSDKIWLTGKDAHLFYLRQKPFDIRTDRYFEYEIIVTRVLPKGNYHFQLQRQEAIFIPCKYHDELSAIDYFIEVLPAEGVLHEGFFDLVGFESFTEANNEQATLVSNDMDTSIGKLSIAKVAWRNQRVEIHLSRPDALQNYHIDFIRNDGTTSQTLSFDTAEQRSSPYQGYKTLIWQISEPLWNSDEDLIFRIRQDAPESQTSSQPQCVIDDLGTAVYDKVLIGNSDPPFLCRLEDSHNYYNMFTLEKTETIEFNVSSTCENMSIYVFEGIGTRHKPIHTFYPRDFQQGNISIINLRRGPYTVELRFPNSDPCTNYKLSIRAKKTRP